MGNVSDFFKSLFSPADVEDDKEDYFVDNRNVRDERDDYNDDRKSRYGRTRVVNFNQSSSRNKSRDENPIEASPVENDRPNISLCIPKVYDDLGEIVAKVMKGQHVIIKFDQIDKKNGQRILDYVSGTAYALGANVANVSQSMIYLVAPKDTNLDDTLMNSAKPAGRAAKKASRNSFIINDEDNV